jgi:O-antigen/teichoic acid export membrane protein
VDAHPKTPPPSPENTTDLPLRSIAIGTLWRFLRYPVIIVSALAIPRLMGPTTYGEYALFLSIYVILDMVSDVGFNQTFGRFLPEMQRGDRQQMAHLLHQLLFSAVIISLLTGVLAIIPVLLLERFSLPPLGYPFLILLLLIARIKGTLFGYIYGMNDIARFSARDFLRSALTLLFVISMHHLWGLAGALGGIFLTETCLLVLSIVWTRDTLFLRPGPIRWATLKPHLLFGFSFYIPMLLLGLLHRAGTPLIEVLTGETEHVGYFDVANQYVTMTGAFLSLIFTTLLPSLTHMHLDDDHSEIGRWQATTMAYCGIVFVLTAHALTMVGHDVIIGCLGDAFAPIYPCAVVLTPAIPAMLIIYAGMNYTLLRKEPRRFTLAILGGLVVMLVASPFCIPRWLGVGAAAASILGYFASAAIIVHYYRDEFIPMLVGFGKVLLLGCLLIPLHFIPLGLVGRMVILMLSCAGFAAAAFGIGIVDFSDVRKVMASITKKA